MKRMIRKFNFIRRCPNCYGEGKIIAAIHRATGGMFFVCDECLAVYRTYQQACDAIGEPYEKVKSLWEKEHCGKFHAFVPAEKEEMIQNQVPVIENKVDFCPDCSAKDGIYAPHVWVYAKKLLATGELYCQCSQCGKAWCSPEALFRGETCDLPDEMTVDATLDDLKNAGWQDDWAAEYR